ncbi:casein kinase [Stylonychia lemnae]|uniref:Casein kinase I n=1 Tax=Stylonychia lemnae TaxID=5949 RepID=A0A078B0N1_STYLE|nr:casein kinase [Stylonychia lemnae]|eukprot:CDW87861.1 casein kinase [Stylonychia lemnae]
MQESSNSKTPQLENESRILEALQYEEGFTAIHLYGQGRDHNYMIIDILGPSLEELFNYCGKRFSLKTSCLIMIQLIKRFTRIHAHNFIHRDIKPENFLLGLQNKSGLIHVVDYGLSKRYFSSQTNQHIPFQTNKGLVGTARYASIHAHMGEELSRRDDMEALGNALLYFFLGQLPWQNLQGTTNSDKYRKIKQVKCGISLD